MNKFSLLILVLVLINACKSNNCQENADNQEQTIQVGNDFFKVETFVLDSVEGWGYKIFKNGRVYIKQDLIPAVNGYFVFKTENDAKIVGDFVLKRMIKHKGMPSITIEELDSLGVLSQEIIDYQKIDFSTKTGILPGK